MNVVDIRQAVLMAADKIERFPEQFDYWACGIPSSTRGCGCALGWVGYFIRQICGQEALRWGSHQAIADAIGVPLGDASSGALVFYRRMSGIDLDWAYQANKCAAALRRYADVYLALPNPSPTPTGEQLCCPLPVAGVGSYFGVDA